MASLLHETISVREFQTKLMMKSSDGLFGETSQDSLLIFREHSRFMSTNIHIHTQVACLYGKYGKIHKHVYIYIYTYVGAYYLKLCALYFRCFDFIFCASYTLSGPIIHDDLQHAAPSKFLERKFAGFPAMFL